MKKRVYSLLVATMVACPFLAAGCSTKEPQVIELTDEAIQRYDALDKDIQDGSGGKYGE